MKNFFIKKIESELKSVIPDFSSNMHLDVIDFELKNLVKLRACNL